MISFFILQNEHNSMLDGPGMLYWKDLKEVYVVYFALECLYFSQLKVIAREMLFKASFRHWNIYKQSSRDVL